MVTSTTASDYFSGRPAARPRLGNTSLGVSASSPRSPKTPLLGRSISSQYGSPGTYRAELDDIVIYELDARSFSAGYAGESQPRCILPFTPDDTRRAGDYRLHSPAYMASLRKFSNDCAWGAGYELYSPDLRDQDLGLVSDKLERALRAIHVDFLQLDQKPRKAVLVVPSLLPTPLLETALRLLFGHYSQPPSIAVLTTPVLCCVSAGLRNALVVDIGWEEIIVTAVGEYKEVFQRRSVRAGKLLTRQIGLKLEEEVKKQDVQEAGQSEVKFVEAEDVTSRMAWCRLRGDGEHHRDAAKIQLSIPSSEPHARYELPFGKLADAVDEVLFDTANLDNDHDDNESPVHSVAYRVLLALPVDLRSSCLERIVITGELGKIPGLKRRFLQETSRLIEARGWDPVSNYGAAAPKREQALKERSANIAARVKPPDNVINLSGAKMPSQASVPHVDRVHDDIKDSITLKAERGSVKMQQFDGNLGGVETLGAWAGASLLASLRIKGVHEIEREDFLKNGLRNVDCL